MKKPILRPLAFPCRCLMKSDALDFKFETRRSEIVLTKTNL